MPCVYCCLLTCFCSIDPIIDIQNHGWWFVLQSWLVRVLGLLPQKSDVGHLTGWFAAVALQGAFQEQQEPQKCFFCHCMSDF